METHQRHTQPRGVREQLAQLFGSAKAQYNARGITSTRADVIDLERIGQRIVIATVRFPHLDANEREVGAPERVVRALGADLAFVRSFPSSRRSV